MNRTDHRSNIFCPVPRFYGHDFARRKVRAPRGRKGVILIAALWALFILSALTLAVNSYVWPQLELSGRLMDKTEAYYLAKAGVERAIFEVNNDETDSYDCLSDSWSSNEAAFKKIELGSGAFSVAGAPNILELSDDSSHGVFSGSEDDDGKMYGLIDEERKININKAPQYVLKNLFEVIGGASANEADRIAVCVLDWRDEDETPQKDGAEDIYYQSLYPPYRSENKWFDVPEKLLLVKGMTPEIFDKIKDKITIYGSGAVNINTADKQVFSVLGISDDLSDKIVYFRMGDDGKEGTEDDDVFSETGAIISLLDKKEAVSGEEESEINRIINDQLLAVQSNNFAGCAAGYAKNRNRFTKIIFIYDRLGGNVIYWRE